MGFEDENQKMKRQGLLDAPEDGGRHAPPWLPGEAMGGKRRRERDGDGQRKQPADAEVAALPPVEPEP